MTKFSLLDIFSNCGMISRLMNAFTFVYDNGSLQMLPATVKISAGISVVFSEDFSCVF